MRAWHLACACVAIAACKQFNPEYCTKYHPDNASYGCSDGGPGGSGMIVPVTIGGTVTGLTGTGLVLQDDNTDDLPIASDGPFTFSMPVFTGHPYAVSVGSQPSAPTQHCTVGNGVGIAGESNITDVAVTCATSAYSVGGTILGLDSGKSITLTLDGTSQTFSSSPFAFTNTLTSGSSYTVAIETQPSAQTCTVAGATGTVGSGDITSVVVNCSATMFTIGGSIAGLNGMTTLLLNGGDPLTLNSNGTFAFSTTLAATTTYVVTVMTQPSYPPQSQTCTVSNGSGTVTTAVSDVMVTCAVNTFSIGGMVSGLSGTLQLLDNGADMLSLRANGSYMFATKIASGSTYAVTVAANPTGQVCTLANATGTVQNSNVTNVNASCMTTGDTSFVCGTGSSCTDGSEQCCLNQSMPSSGTCVTAGSSCGGSKAVITCDDAADCGGGKVCCAVYNSSGTIQSASCTQQNQCTGTGGNSVEIWCDPNASSPCPGNAQCTGNAMIRGRATCQ